jgi:hypothetical protein
VPDSIGIAEITEALKNQLESLVEEKKRIAIRGREVDIQIGALHQSLSGLLLYADALDQTDEKLTALFKAVADMLFPSNSTATLTEACRKALRESKRRMSAVEVKKAVESGGFDFSGYTSNPLSSIHTTLKRLKESGDAKETTLEGTKYYQWIIRRTETPPIAVGTGVPAAIGISEELLKRIQSNPGLGLGFYQPSEELLKAVKAVSGSGPFAELLKSRGK